MIFLKKLIYVLNYKKKKFKQILYILKFFFRKTYFKNKIQCFDKKKSLILEYNYKKF